MYVIRPALRAPTGRRPAPALFICGRRYPPPLRLRTLHTTRTLQAARPPPAPNSTPIGGNDITKTDRKKAVEGEQLDATAAANEDPEILAQKLQRSREAARRYSAALRRQLRSKKSEGLPPVYIPDWFLKRKVIRREDVSDGIRQHPSPTCLSVSVAHEESNEQATCSIPASRDLDAAQVLSRLVRGLWGHRLDDNEKRKVEQYLQDRIALVEKASLGKLAETTKDSDIDKDIASTSTAHGQGESTKGSSSFPILEQMFGELMEKSNVSPEHLTDRSNLLARELVDLKRLATKLDDLRADTTLRPQQKLQAATKLEAKIESWIKKRVAAKKRRASTSTRMSPLMLAEIRATIAASLSALHPSAGDLFPSTKTNLIIHSPAAEHENLVDTCIHKMARHLGSELIILQASDLAQLLGDYLGEGSEPTPRSIRSLGYETYRLNTELRSVEEEVPEPAEEESESSQPPPIDSNVTKTYVYHMPIKLQINCPNTVQVAQDDADASAPSDNGRDFQIQNETRLEDLKLTAFLDGLIDASNVKQSRGLIGTEDTTLPRYKSSSATPTGKPAFFDYSIGSEGIELELNSALPPNADAGISMTVGVDSAISTQARIPDRSKIIYVKDFKEMNATHYGGRIIQKLEELVRKRRASGESVMIIGSTCSRDLTPDLTADGVRGLQGDDESSYFRTIVVETDSGTSQSNLDEAFAAIRDESGPADLSSAETRKFWSINLAHIRDMLRSLDTVTTTSLTNMEQSSRLFHKWTSIFPESYLKRVLTYDEVHRIALTAFGLSITSPTTEATGGAGTTAQMNWAHVILAMGLLRASDTAKYASFDRAPELSKKPQSSVERLEAQANAKLTADKKLLDEKNLLRQRQIQRITAEASKYEKRLLTGIVNPDQIKTTFDQVHVPQDTIDSIRTITSLSLLRPDAFNYGILATEKISGALLYGPPGTGKTLLAKAVAKESGSTVLEVSGSSIMDKYVGEGEKNVAAIFSLARKLSPCIVFLDEADAIFASRDVMRERSSHRDILNQFLKEWDGLNDLSVFVMVATNRPFDLDDAVIRRLPRRLLVDLPTQADRKEILQIHLRGEQLDDSVDLSNIAMRTPFYSGSDLKNIAVSAALACVKEENEHAVLTATTATPETETPVTDTTPQPIPSEPTAFSSLPKSLHLVPGHKYMFPEKRTLHARHFDQALREISASISEDMSSLNAIKKFDDQYGDRKGIKKRKDFGFGVTPKRDESAARVRV
ncbi:ATPase family AAA domain-containing protein 1-A [Phaeosphaeriaceae sp. PMI808]|nr:ATPase family AAA domain-containing protein 1-A [Phaeosphaeriaceae sp. PMI808]